jgi:PPP family 3-phenylpropionic acid transporter
MRTTTAALSLRLFYITNFAVLGIYLPYFNLFLEEIGFDGPRIGTISALLPLSTLLMPAAGGTIADRWGRRRLLVVLSATLATLCFALLLQARSFGAVAVVVLLFALLRAPALPLVEAMAIELQSGGGPAYGRLRAWGSAAFIVTALAGGPLLAGRGDAFVVRLVLGLLVLNVAAALRLPADAPRVAGPPPAGALRQVLLSRGTLLFLAAGALSQAAHGPYYVFYSIHLEQAGYSPTAIGGLWGWAVACEVIVMLQMSRVLARAPAPWVMIGALLVAAIRWSICAWSVSPAAMIAAQAMHAATYAAFHVAAVTWTHRLFGGTLGASGQGIYGAATYGLGNVLGMIGSGWLYGAVPLTRLFACAAGVAVAGAALLIVPTARRAGPAPRL